MRQFKKAPLVVLILMTMSVQAKQGLSPRMHAQFEKAQLLIETESWLDARIFLNALNERVSHKYAKALIAQSLGQISIHEENLVAALNHFQQAYDFEVFNKDQNSRLLYSIAQLHCAVDEWVNCREKLAIWMLESPDKIRANDYIMIAQAFSRTDDWPSVISPVKKALQLKKQFKKMAPITWHQLLVAAHSTLEQWSLALAAQEDLLKHYVDKAVEWRRLVSFHLQLDHHQLALASMRIPFQQGLLTTEQDYRHIAQLMLYNGLPFLAATSLNSGLESKGLTRSIKNLKLLSSAWVQANEFERAITVYEELVAIEPKRIWLKKLAQLHIQTQHWERAVEVLRYANKLKAEAKLDLMLGIVLMNLHRFDDAQLSLTAAAKDLKLKKMTDNWLLYLKQLQV